MSIEVWIAVAAALAAWAAAAFAFYSYRTAKRALSLQEEEHMWRRPSLVPYLIDSMGMHRAEHRLVAISLSVSNRSTVGNSIARLDLKVTFSTSSGLQQNVVLQHNHVLSEEIDLPGKPALSIPTRIEARDTVIGWALFKLVRSVLGSSDIQSYELSITDSHGSVCTVEPILIIDRDESS